LGSSESRDEIGLGVELAQSPIRDEPVGSGRWSPAGVKVLDDDELPAFSQRATKRFEASIEVRAMLEGFYGDDDVVRCSRDVVI
jgi:hypothetical protein